MDVHFILSFCYLALTFAERREILLPDQNTQGVADTDKITFPEDLRSQPSEGIESVDYSGSQLWNVNIQHGIEIVSELSKNHVISTWGGNRSYVDVLIKSDYIDNITKLFKEKSIQYSVIIYDVQKNIEIENPPLSEEQILLQNRKGHRMTWQQYHRLNDIHGLLEYLSTTYPKHCTRKSIGKSWKGRDIMLLKISNGRPGNRAIFIDGGIHAREWISPATVTYLMNHIAENFDTESDDIRNIDWYFVPVLNPDGYEYTHTVDRLWRKNRKGIGACAGVDLNRNFGYHWGGKGGSKYPCSETYAGTNAFSEPEAKAVSDFIMNSGVNFNGYLSYHSYGQYILHPWGYDSVLPPDHEDLTNVALEMAKAIESSRGSKYKVGASSILLYPAAGGSDDWAKAVPNIKYSYTIELSDTGRHGFVLPASYIVPVATESLAGLRVLTRKIRQL